MRPRNRSTRLSTCEKSIEAIGRRKRQCAGHNAVTGAPLTEREVLWQVKPLKKDKRKQLGARKNRRRLPASWSAETKRPKPLPSLRKKFQNSRIEIGIK